MAHSTTAVNAARMHGSGDGQVFALIVMVVAACEVVIGLGRVGNDRQPLDLGQLHDIAAVRAGSPGHRERLP